MPLPLAQIRGEYERAKSVCAQDWPSDSAGTAVRDLVLTCLRFLQSECSPVTLVSKVKGKNYISFARRGAKDLLSRPANVALFSTDPRVMADRWDDWIVGALQPGELAGLSYTAALAPCLAMELFDRQNKKGPATYFECLIGHIFARSLHASPQKRVTLDVCGRPVRLTMDFLFDLGKRGRVHLPVKMSTRERVVQAWAHQRILDGAYGAGAYKGIMVLFSETKLDSRTHEVVEICVPDQWLTYQTLLARMERIYYFDVPQRYRELAGAYPDVMTVRPFGDFFTEITSVLRARR
jgi:hypothetical protein